jgi:hypothetical protein
MLARTARPHSLEKFRAGHPGKVKIENKQVRARLLARIYLIEKSCRSFPVVYDQKFTSYFMLLKRFYHEFYVCGIVVNQQNLSKRLCRYQLGLALLLEA